MTTETVPGPGIFATPPKGRRTRDPEPLTRFLQRYKNLIDAQAWRDVEKFKESFNDLRPRIKSMLDAMEEQVRLHAPTFNIFKALHLEGRADEIHTPLLASLLDPQGDHGQRHLFLKAFIHAMAQGHEYFPVPEGEIDIHQWFVAPHKYIGHGTLDIVLSSPAMSYQVVIRNRIYTEDQDDELRRYFDWLEDNRDYYRHQALVVLTPTGEAIEDIDPHSYFTASYRGQISDMLRKVLPGISATHLRETILQYLDIVRKI
ncbi:PD-(D/E)XK nuclease family protein [Candidatus Neomarinimicrobiota bacterium]